MAITDKQLQAILAKLTPEEQELLIAQINRISDEPDTIPLKPIEPKESKIYSCVYCESANCIKYGMTNQGRQRYRCNDCERTFSENHGESFRYSHLSQAEWLEILRGIVEELSIPKIAKNVGRSTATVWLAKMKVNQALMTMYGYKELFQGVTQADEYYTRAAFKGKRDPEFFIYVLRRMPRTHRTYAQKVAYLQDAGLYDTLLRDEPEFLAELLEENPKMKRGISNEQICILTLVDDTGKLYLEPVSVGRLEKAMAKAKLKPLYTPSKENVLVTDDHNAYDRVLYGTGTKHEVISAKKHTNGKYNLAKVNSVHSALSAYMDNKKGKVFNTKYLDLTLMLFCWLQKYKKYTTDQKVKMLYDIMTDNISEIELREQVNQVTAEELTNREITLDTKGEFPKKL